MPIEIGAEIRAMNLEEFRAIDYRVTGYCYDVHSRLGRLCEEKTYQNELLHQFREGGLQPAVTEAPIDLIFGDYTKRLYIDLLVLGGAIFEIKAVDRLHPSHESQLLNYMLLTGLKQGKLINMATDSVQGKRMLTKLTHSERRRIEVIDMGAQPDERPMKEFRQITQALLADWGAFLSPHLYASAVSVTVGGVRRRTRISQTVNDRSIGSVDMWLLTPDTAFEITSITKNVSSHETHLRCLLAHTRLTSIEWINLNHHQVCYRTLSRE